MVDRSINIEEVLASPHLLENALPCETTIPVPFPAVDAALWEYLVEQYPFPPITARRVQTTTGSVVYHLRPQKGRTEIGSYHIRMMGIESTRLRIVAGPALDLLDQDDRTRMRAFILARIHNFLAWLQHDYNKALDAAEDQREPDVSGIIERLTIEEDSHEPPRRGASLDKWLDWRDREHARARNIPLKRIAEMGGFSESTVRKKSATRNKNVPKEEQ